MNFQLCSAKDNIAVRPIALARDMEWREQLVADTKHALELDSACVSWRQNICTCSLGFDSCLLRQVLQVVISSSIGRRATKRQLRVGVECVVVAVGLVRCLLIGRACAPRRARCGFWHCADADVDADADADADAERMVVRLGSRNGRSCPAVADFYACPVCLQKLPLTGGRDGSNESGHG